MNKLKQVTSKVVDSLLKNPHKKNYEKEYITLLEQIVELRDKRNFFDDWMVDFFIEDIIDTAEPLLNDYKTLSVDGKKCAKYMLHHYIYWYYNTDQEDAGDVLKYKTELKAKIKYESSYVENLLSPKQKLDTEDTGLQFEMAICLALGIDYNKKNYKYGMEIPEKIKPRLEKLKELFPPCSHSKILNSRYDYTSIDGTKHLSAKSSKSKDPNRIKVAPQKPLGQPSTKVFCEHFDIEFVDIYNLKKYIQENITSILYQMVEYTFSCPNIIFIKETETIRYIELSSPIRWEDYKFVWSCDYNKWNNSSLLKILYKGEYINLCEFQFHQKKRTNMANRWFYENFLTIFKDKLNITSL
jgi:hypothetical protein